MIRSAFLRRMAQVAMAGMLGAELMWRAPKVSRLLGEIGSIVGKGIEFAPGKLYTLPELTELSSGYFSEVWANVHPREAP